MYKYFAKRFVYLIFERDEKTLFFSLEFRHKKIQLVPQVEEMGGQIQQNGGLGGNHHQGQDTKPRQVTSVQVRRGL